MDVKVIQTEGESALVEWRDGDSTLRRAYVPLTAVKNKTVHGNTLEAGIPYGIAWADVIGELKATPAEIARRLQEAGIWTAQDLFKNGNAALGAIQTAYGLDLATLMNAAQEHLRGGK